MAHALCTSQALRLWSAPETRNVCALSAGSRQLRVRSKLEKSARHFAREERRRKRRSTRCSRVEAVPWSEEVALRFGTAGVKFVEVAGFRIVEMRLSEGSSARVVLQNALVSSYKSRMWHGGLEELLYTAVVPGRDESERPSTFGGIGVQVWESDTDTATACWNVENVTSNPAMFVQVTLSTTSTARNGTLEFKYVLTLTKASLSCALIATNVGESAVSVRGSFQTSVAVNFVDGVFAIGLQGCKYLAGAPDKSPKSGEGIFSWFSGGEGDKKRKERRENEVVVEEQEMVRLKGGFERRYTEASDCVALLDRGKRRTINFHNNGLGEVRLSNPGEESGVEDWDSFVSIELARSIEPVRLEPGQEWRAAQQLENPSK